MENNQEMALSEFTRKMVEIKMNKYCREKVPGHLRHKVRVDFKIRGNNVTLFEVRPTLHDPNTWVDISIAQFRYDDKNNVWKLFCADRNSRWHEYYEAEPTHNFEALLEEVDDDPTGIFWG